MEFNYEKIVQAAVVGMICVYVLQMVLAGQKVPNKKLAMPVLASMLTSYIMGNKSLTLKGDDNLQIYVASMIGAYAYDNM